VNKRISIVIIAILATVGSMIFTTSAIAYTRTECVKIEEGKGVETSTAETYCEEDENEPEKKILLENAKQLNSEGLSILSIVLPAIVFLIAAVVLAPKGIALIKRFI